VDDAEGLRSTLDAMAIVGMNEDERNAILQVRARVLCTGWHVWGWEDWRGAGRLTVQSGFLFVREEVGRVGGEKGGGVEGPRAVVKIGFDVGKTCPLNQPGMTADGIGMTVDGRQGTPAPWGTDFGG